MFFIYFLNKIIPMIISSLAVDLSGLNAALIAVGTPLTCCSWASS
jgi:hypothetical protein